MAVQCLFFRLINCAVLLCGGGGGGGLSKLVSKLQNQFHCEAKSRLFHFFLSHWTEEEFKQTSHS